MTIQSHTTAQAMTSRYTNTHSVRSERRTARTTRPHRWTRRVFRPVIRPAASL